MMACKFLDGIFATSFNGVNFSNDFVYKLNWIQKTARISSVSLLLQAMWLVIYI